MWKSGNVNITGSKASKSTTRREDRGSSNNRKRDRNCIRINRRNKNGRACAASLPFKIRLAIAIWRIVDLLFVVCCCVVMRRLQGRMQPRKTTCIEGKGSWARSAKTSRARPSSSDRRSIPVIFEIVIALNASNDGTNRLSIGGVKG